MHFLVYSKGKLESIHNTEACPFSGKMTDCYNSSCYYIQAKNDPLLQKFRNLTFIPSFSMELTFLNKGYSDNEYRTSVRVFLTLHSHPTQSMNIMVNSAKFLHIKIIIK